MLEEGRYDDDDDDDDDDGTTEPAALCMSSTYNVCREEEQRLKEKMEELQVGGMYVCMYVCMSNEDED